MSQYTGFLKRLSGIEGDFSRENLNINIEIHPENKKRNLSFSIPPKYGIKFVNYTALSGAVKKINAIYRFISAKSELITGRKAKPITAPASPVEVDSTVQMGKKAPLAAHPANGISVDHKERVLVYAKLVAYRRAGCRYIKKLYLKRISKLQAAPGAVAKYAEDVKLERISKAIVAESVIIESRFNTIEYSYEATGCSAPAQIVPATESTFFAEHTATANTGTVVDANVDSLQKAKHSALLYAWFLPELDGDTLSVFQVFSGVQSGNVLEIDLEEESTYWANATVTDGTLNLVFAETATPNDTILEVV